MPIPRGMTERERRMYWGTVHKLVEQGMRKERAERLAWEYVRRKRRGGRRRRRSRGRKG